MIRVYPKIAFTIGLATLTFGAINIYTTSSQAATLSNGSLEVTVRPDNGAIDTIIFDNTKFSSSDFFNPGAPVSDFGFQNGTNISTFVRNTTTGFTQQPVDVASTEESVVVTGTYTGGGANVDFTRTYSLVAGLNALLIETDFVNNGSDIALRYFDTFDPDQGIDQGNGFGTFNDILTLDTPAGEATIGQATELDGLTVIFGSLDTNVTVGAGLGLSINNGFELNNFFSSAFDPNGTFADIGTHIGAIEFLLGNGEGTSFQYLHGYGQSVEAAQEEFINAASVDVPEPSSFLGLLTVGVLATSSLIKSQKKLKL